VGVPGLVARSKHTAKPRCDDQDEADAEADSDCAEQVEQQPPEDAAVALW